MIRRLLALADRVLNALFPPIPDDLTAVAEAAGVLIQSARLDQPSDPLIDFAMWELEVSNR